MEVSASLQDPDVPARQRLRAANDLSERISRGLVESLGSRRRYADHTVDYWHSDVVLDELTTVATELPDDDPANLRVADVDVPYKEQLLAQFGAEARLKQPATHGVPALARRLGIEPTAARVLKLALFARFVPPPQIG